ncbi:MAG: hypothetical protein ACP5PS_00030 [Bacteroidales bacterium]
MAVLLQERKYNGRIRAYIQKMGVFIIPFFEALLDEKLTELQIQNLLLAGILTPLFDDALETGNADNYLKIVYQQPVELTDSGMILFSKAFMAMISGISNHNTFYQQLQQIISHEKNRSAHQGQLGKGSAALLLFATCANLEVNPLHNDFIYRTGGYFQLIDDIYDCSKDCARQIDTLPIRWSSQHGKLQKFLTLQLLRLIHHPCLQGLPQKNKKTIEGMLFVLYRLALMRMKIPFLANFFNRQTMEIHSSVH